MDEQTVAGPKSPGRWVIVAAGAWLQLVLGTVYAWSFFQKPLADTYGWSNSQVAWVFSLAICFLGLAAAWGGTKLPAYGPRRLAAVGGVLFGLGYLLAAVALCWRSLPLLYFGYGVVGGTGLGLGYVTPVATVAKWFPDKKGLATGLVIMGFGFGALLMSKLIAPVLCRWSNGNLAVVFAVCGVLFTAAAVLAALLLKNPPAAAPTQAPAGCAATCPTAGDVALLSPHFAAIWAVFFCNIVAGISIISFQSPLFQDLWRLRDPMLSAETLAGYGGWLIAVSAIFNGVGRMLWGGLSDRIGRLAAFRLMLASQMLVFAILPAIGNPWAFAAAICYVLLCYGGGFGTMPSLIADLFGQRRMAVAYGAVLTAWSAAGIVGPQIVARLKDDFPARATSYSFFISAAVLGIGLLLSFTYSSRSA
jgi:MFS transporter, OFA family, oxalate/formate antiporter